MFENNNGYFTAQHPAQTGTLAKSFMASVFLWMTVAMAVTALTAFWFAATPSLLGSLVSFETGRMTMLGWIVTLAPLGFVLLMSFGYQKLSPAILTLLFLGFSILMGMSLSFVLLIYTAASVYKTFAITAG